ncbi:MAG: acetyl-CoA carboxylase biotin carboxyl carrier protein [Planctomycetaceae bacterium]|nr:acetyl-CoA carboxylase biotin carboxyl carrier protein [Planctomycetaceae bacterium]
MSITPSSLGDAFDVRKIRRLAELMNEHDLAEIDLRQGDVRVCLRRQGAAVTAVGPGYAEVLAPVSRGESRPKGGDPAPAAEDANTHVITSPMVGTFYSASSPDTPPFAKVGDHVGPDTTVCIVEAMKVFNEIPAGIAGKVIGVLVENGEPVEFGQPLFKVDTRK